MLVKSKTLRLLASLILCAYSMLVSNIAVAAVATTSQFLTFTDVHFDPFLACGQTVPCPLIHALQYTAPEQWRAILAKATWPPQAYFQDTSYEFMVSALAAGHSRMMAQPVRFVLLMGDVLAHNYHKKFIQFTGDVSDEHYQAFVKQTMQFLSFEIKQAFAPADVYYVIGNNDTYIENYTYRPHDAFFADMAETWSALVGDTHNNRDMRQTFPRGGYYAVTAPQLPALRLIILNSVIFSSKAHGVALTEAVQTELRWLKNELQNARHANQKVLLVMHIPPGIDVFMSLLQHPYITVNLWQTTATQEFLHLVHDYAGTIAAVLPSHLHNDWLQMITGGEKPVPVIGNPSISPVYGNNPSFKMYTYSAADGLDDFTTYYFALNADQQWHKEFRFRETYLPTCPHCLLMQGIDNIQLNNGFATVYKKYFSVSSMNTVLVEKYWQPYLWCQIHHFTSTLDYQSCLTTTAALTKQLG